MPIVVKAVTPQVSTNLIYDMSEVRQALSLVMHLPSIQSYCDTRPPHIYNPNATRVVITTNLTNYDTKRYEARYP
jgi:hypothetical protein